MRPAVVVSTLLLVLAGCGGDDGGRPRASSGATSSGPVELDRDLRAELLAMERRDQRQRAGGTVGETDEERTARLAEIVEEHGWPTIDLVGRDGEDAAWVIAQHSDLDPAFQAEALELLRGAVERGQASPGNLAYLEDRVAVGRGEPQTYGTQVACAAGGPEPSTPIADPGTLDERREEAGLEPFEAYLREMGEVCASDGS